MKEGLKFILITSVCYIIFDRITNIKFNLFQKLSIGTGFVILTTSVLLINKNSINEPYKTILLIVVSSVLLTVISRERFESTLTAFIFAYAVSYILFAVALTISAVILDRFNIFGGSIVVYCMTCVWESIFIFMLSKTKTNINILSKKGAGGIGLIICGIVFILYSLFREHFEYREYWLLLAGIALTGYGIFYWWKRETVIAHNDRVNEIINKRLQGKLDEKVIDIERLKNSHDYLASAVHKDNKTLDALQKVVEDIIARSNQTEIKINARTILAEINVYRKHLLRDFSKTAYKGNSLPLTGLQLVDAKLKILLEEASGRNIDFTLNIDGNIKGIIQIIPQLDLVNIIGDFVENSFMAIRHLRPPDAYRGIFVRIGMVQNEYELSVEDSGIPFDIDTLICLGKTKITTHTNEGGSGYGYMTVFEKLNIYGASLTITEYEQASHIYSKCVAVRFDGNKDYAIKSYRADLIREQNTNDALVIY